MSVRVLVVGHSPVGRGAVHRWLEEDPAIHVVGEAADGRAARRSTESLAPDLVTMDIDLPGEDALDVIEWIMSSRPVPILVITGRPFGSGERAKDRALQAIRRGALEVVAMPPTDGSAEGAALGSLVRRLASVPVVRHPRRPDASSPRRGVRDPSAARASARCRVVGIGGSTGGPGAIAGLLAALPGCFAATVAVVQHLPHGFGAAFERFLAERSRLPVRRVDGPIAAEPGTVLLPADGLHLVADGADAFDVSDAPASGGHRPSVDVLLRSVAAGHGAAGAAVVLSGIGSDGAAGVRAVREAGGATFAQDEATCAVYGMPRAALEQGGAERVLPVCDIAAALAALASPHPPPEARGP